VATTPEPKPVLTAPKPKPTQPQPQQVVAKAPNPAKPKPEPTKSPAKPSKPTQPTVYQPIEGPAAPVSAEKQQRLHELLSRYQADQVTPEQYHAERAKILAAP